MGLKETLAKQTGLSLVNSVLSTLFGVSTFFLLVRLLPREHIAVLGISAGFLATLSPLLITPEVMLFKNFNDYKSNKNKYISAFLFFWSVRSAAIMLLIIAASFLFWAGSNPLLLIYVIGAGLVMNLAMLQASIQEIFFIELRQMEIIKANVLYYTIFIALLALLLLFPQLLLYLAISIGLALIFSVIWIYKLLAGFNFKPDFSVSANIATIKEMLVKVVLWNHFINSVFSFVYKADVFILSFFATAYATGNYTIALMFSSGFILIPQILQKMCSTALAYSKEGPYDSKIVSAFIKYGFFISAVQLITYLLFGKLILSYFVSDNVDNIINLGFFIVLGVNIYNIFRPLHSLGQIRTDLKKYFIWVFLPQAAITLLIYYFAAQSGGSELVAQSNIAVYLAMSLLITIFVLRETRFRPVFELLSADEKGILKSALNKLSAKPKA